LLSPPSGNALNDDTHKIALILNVKCLKPTEFIMDIKWKPIIVLKSKLVFDEAHTETYITYVAFEELVHQERQSWIFIISVQVRK